MPIVLKPGARIFSTISATEMVVIRAPDGPIDLTIGGKPPVMSIEHRRPLESEPTMGERSAMGKRYVDAEGTIELLCTKPGAGLPAVAGQPLQFKQAKALPSSD